MATTATTATTFAEDQLAALFAASLTLTLSPSAPSTQFYSSAHYTPSTHHLPPTDSTITATLLAHGINPSYLFPAQLSFFSSAPLDVRLRLLDLWRSAPFRAGDKDAIRYRYGELLSTSVMQEEIMARLRMERDVAEAKVVATAEPYMADGYGRMEDSYGQWMEGREREVEMGM